MPWGELRKRTNELLGELGVPVSSAALAWGSRRVVLGLAGISWVESMWYMEHAAAAGCRWTQKHASAFVSPCDFSSGGLTDRPPRLRPSRRSPPPTQPRSPSVRCSPIARSTFAPSRQVLLPHCMPVATAACLLLVAAACRCALRVPPTPLPGAAMHLWLTRSSFLPFFCFFCRLLAMIWTTRSSNMMWNRGRERPTFTACRCVVVWQAVVGTCTPAPGTAIQGLEQLCCALDRWFNVVLTSQDRKVFAQSTDCREPRRRCGVPFSGGGGRWAVGGATAAAFPGKRFEGDMSAAVDLRRESELKVNRALARQYATCFGPLAPLTSSPKSSALPSNTFRDDVAGPARR